MTTIEVIRPPGALQPIFTVDGEPTRIDRLEWREALNEPTRIWVNGHRSEGPVRIVVRGVVVCSDLGTDETPFTERARVR